MPRQNRNYEYESNQVQSQKCNYLWKCGKQQFINEVVVSFRPNSRVSSIQKQRSLSNSSGINITLLNKQKSKLKSTKKINANISQKNIQSHQIVGNLIPKKQQSQHKKITNKNLSNLKKAIATQKNSQSLKIRYQSSKRQINDKQVEKQQNTFIRYLGDNLSPYQTTSNSSSKLPTIAEVLSSSQYSSAYLPNMEFHKASISSLGIQEPHNRYKYIFDIFQKDRISTESIQHTEIISMNNPQQFNNKTKKTVVTQLYHNARQTETIISEGPRNSEQLIGQISEEPSEVSSLVSFEKSEFYRGFRPQFKIDCISQKY